MRLDELKDQTMHITYDNTGRLTGVCIGEDQIPAGNIRKIETSAEACCLTDVTITYTVPAVDMKIDE